MRAWEVSYKGGKKIGLRSHRPCIKRSRSSPPTEAAAAPCMHAGAGCMACARWRRGRLYLFCQLVDGLFNVQRTVVVRSHRTGAGDLSGGNGDKHLSALPLPHKLGAGTGVRSGEAGYEATADTIVPVLTNRRCLSRYHKLDSLLAARVGTTATLCGSG